MSYCCHVCGYEFGSKQVPLQFYEHDLNSKIIVYCSLDCKNKKKKKVKHKFNAKICESDGIKFGSKAERAYYHKLQALQKSGEVLFFLRQCPFELPGNTKYFVDFQVFYADGTISFIDVKGHSTPLFIMKKKQVEDIYPIEIEIVKRR